MKWIILLFFCFHINIKGQSDEYFNIFTLYQQQIFKTSEIEPEVDTSCSIEQPNFFRLHLMCPTQRNCYLKTYFKTNQVLSPPLFHFNSDQKCETMDGAQLPVNKTRQLHSVLQILKLSNQSECDFASIETLDVRYNKLLNMGQLGGANHKMDTGSSQKDQCPFNLKFLDISGNEIKVLKNNSFFQFKRLEYLGMLNCGLERIQADAFVHLKHLKEVTLAYNRLGQLPSNVFRNNVQLQTIDFESNQLQNEVLNSLFSIKTLQHLFLDSNDIRVNNANDLLTFPSTLIRLTISFNNVLNVGLEYSKLINLTHLYIYDNGIKEVDEKAFQHLHFLTEINLKNNEISQLGESTFKNNLKLKTLSLRNNTMSQLPPVAHLTTLEQLIVSGNEITSIKNTDLNNCTQLAHLNLCYNRISVIEAHAFQNTKQLLKLYLCHNRLTTLPAQFQHLNLMELRLDYNNFTTFSYTHLPPSLTQLNMSSNQIASFQRFNFSINKKPRNEWKLSHLYLSNNRIASIRYYHLAPSLQHIDLSGNKLSKLTAYSELMAVAIGLSSVDMRHNNISTICVTSFQVNPNPSFKLKLYIAGNPLDCNCDNIWLKYEIGSHRFADLNEVYCQDKLHMGSPPMPLTTLPDDRFLCRSDHLNRNRCLCPPIFIRQCQAPCPTDCTCLSDLTLSTAHINCSGKNHKHIPNDLEYFDDYLEAIFTLYVNGNNISDVTPIDFGPLSPNFIALHLSNSRIISVNNNAFDQLTNLTFLDLSTNRLQHLPTDIFIKLKQLTSLDLSNNQLAALADDAFVSLHQLIQLNLHVNQLKHLSLNRIRHLTSLKNLTLHDNPWSCDCSFIEPFKSFLVDPRLYVLNQSQITCTSKDKIKLNVLNYDMKPCFITLNLTILVSTATIAAVIIVVSILIFIYRREVQVLVYSRYGLRIFHRRQPEEEVEGKQYDAFIAYNSKDEDFLLKDLMPGLEAIERPYRLCIHERDFPGGSYIQDSILDAIKMSSRTIVILSENFVQSGWCRYEFKSAHMQMLEDRCPRILVIVLGEVPETLDPEMRLYLSTNTYLSWGERLFWQKLYYAMPDLRVTTPATDIMPMRNF